MKRKNMIIIIGLGNPGEKFKNTRHNLGFMVIDAFAEKNNFPEFKLSKKFNTEISEDIFNNEKIVLAKPQTYMNKSGKAVKKIVSNTKTTRPVLVVIHDDIDLPVGIIKIVKNRGSAGHKGVESIIKEIDTKNFVRFRIGTKPKTCNLKPKTVKTFVLQKFNKEEEKIIKEILKKIVEAIEISLKEGIEKAMSKYNC